MTEISIIDNKKVVDFWESEDGRLALALENDDKEMIFVLIEMTTNPVDHFEDVQLYETPHFLTNEKELYCGAQLENCRWWIDGMLVQRYYASFDVYLESDKKWLARFTQDILLHTKYLRDNEDECDRFMTNTWYPTVTEISAVEYAALVSE